MYYLQKKTYSGEVGKGEGHISRRQSLLRYIQVADLVSGKLNHGIWLR